MNESTADVLNEIAHLLELAAANFRKAASGDGAGLDTELAILQLRQAGAVSQLLLGCRGNREDLH